MEFKDNRSATVILTRYKEFNKSKKEIEKILLNSSHELDYITIWNMKERLKSLNKALLAESKKFKKETNYPIELFLGEVQNDNCRTE